MKNFTFAIHHAKNDLIHFRNIVSVIIFLLFYFNFAVGAMYNYEGNFVFFSGWPGFGTLQRLALFLYLHIFWNKVEFQFMILIIIFDTNKYYEYDLILCETDWRARNHRSALVSGNWHSLAGYSTVARRSCSCWVDNVCHNSVIN